MYSFSLLVQLGLQRIEILFGIVGSLLSFADCVADLVDDSDTFLDLFAKSSNFSGRILETTFASLNASLEFGHIFFSFSFSDLRLGHLFACKADVQVETFNFRLLRKELGTADFEDFFLVTFDLSFDERGLALQLL